MAAKNNIFSENILLLLVPPILSFQNGGMPERAGGRKKVVYKLRNISI